MLRSCKPFLLTFLVGLIACQFSLHNTQKKIVLYKQTINKNHSNFIKLKIDSIVAEGFFYGTEFQSNGAPVYFESKLDSIEVNGPQISFVLVKYKFSKRSPGEEGGYTDNLPGNGEIPIILKFPQRLIGTITDDKLTLKRFSMIYNSTFDEMNFVRQ
jgi:hypothetical protein